VILDLVEPVLEVDLEAGLPNVLRHDLGVVPPVRPIGEVAVDEFTRRTGEPSPLP
jgi:hypothetical protein